MTITRRSLGLGCWGCGWLGAASATRRAAAEEAPDLRISWQDGFGSLPLCVALDRRLIETHAAQLGLLGLRIEPTRAQGAAVSADALAGGQVNVAIGTTTGLLALWDQTDGEVRGIDALGGEVFTLVTRNPDVHAIVDFAPSDRIAVPALRVSPQSVCIGMALDQSLGLGSQGRLDAIQVPLDPAAAVTMLLNPSSEVNSHFSAQPWAATELRSGSPKIHAVLTSPQVFGGPATTMSAYAARRFVDANPIKTAAVVAALDEANEVIARDRLDAASSYIALTNESTALDVLADLLGQPGTLYSGVPTRTLVLAAQMARAGVIRRAPSHWREVYYPFLHDRAGS